MMKFTKSLKTLGMAALIGLGVMGTAQAQQPSFSDVLEAIQRDSNAMSAENEQRLQQFRQAGSEQAAQVAQLRSEVNAIQSRARALSTEFDANERRLSELDTQLSQEAGDFSDLLGQFRTAAGETMPVISRSFSNFEYTGRVEALAEVAEARTLPSRADLDTLPKAILMEMIAQSEVKSFTAPVANSGPNGENATQELFRVGVWEAALVDSGKFVNVKEAEGAATTETFLQVLPAQPPGRYQAAIRDLIAADANEVVRAPVDPSKGQLFEIFGDLPTLSDRIADGGPIGMIILALAAIGILIGLYKLVTIFLMRSSMSATEKTRQAGTSNPLARVFETYEVNKNADLETLELKLDETILKETPKIERFIDIIKVLAGVAPLLGLLGTVVGMIITFTQITLYGAGDPQIMAGGISVALMTTVFGLVAAIPLLLLHAIVSGAAKGAQQVLDEQAAGLVAERAERAGRTA